MFRVSIRELAKLAQRCALFPVIYAIPRWWAVLLALYGGYEQQQVGRCMEASKKIAAGNSEAHVVSVLGLPTARFDRRSEAASAFFGSVPRKWAYGTILDLDYLFVRGLPFPIPYPIRIRWWSPDTPGARAKFESAGQFEKPSKTGRKDAKSRELRLSARCVNLCVALFVVETGAPRARHSSNFIARDSARLFC